MVVFLELDGVYTEISESNQKHTRDLSLGIPSVSSQRRGFEAFTITLLLAILKTYYKTSFLKQAGARFTNGFSGPNCYRDFQETGPSCKMTTPVRHARRVQITHSVTPTRLFPWQSLSSRRRFYLTSLYAMAKMAKAKPVHV